MHTTYVRITEHHFKIIADSANLMTMFKQTFHSEKVIPNQGINLTVLIHAGYETPFVKNQLPIDEYTEKLTYRNDSYLIRIEKNDRMAHLYVYNRQALKAAVCNLYSLFIILSGWGLMVCGKYECENGKAKVTIGDLKVKTYLVLKILPVATTVSTFPFQELEEARQTASLPVKCIQIQHYSLQNKRLKIDQTNALIQLLDFVLCWPIDTELVKNVIILLNQLVMVTPVYQRHSNRIEQIKLGKIV
jgi:hypothetical protein